MASAVSRVEAGKRADSARIRACSSASVAAASTARRRASSVAEAKRPESESNSRVISPETLEKRFFIS